MKSKRVKALSVCLAIALVALAAALLWSVSRSKPKSSEASEYLPRFTEVPGKELLAELEVVFDINFPEVIQQVRTARTFPTQNNATSLFAVRFSAEPDAVERFVNSLYGAGLGRLYPYSPESDRRKDLATWLVPEWYLENIGGGREGRFMYAIGFGSMYFDTTLEERHVIYLSGSAYLDKRSEERGER